MGKAAVFVFVYKEKVKQKIVTEENEKQFFLCKEEVEQK